MRYGKHFKWSGIIAGNFVSEADCSWHFGGQDFRKAL